MRILQVDVHYGGSSTGKIVQGLHRAFLSKGHDSWVRHGRGDRSDELNVKRIATPVEVGLHAGMTRLTGWIGPFSPFSTQTLIDDIRQLRPDVVHLHELHGYYVDYLRVIDFLAETRTPTVWTFHCEFMYTGKCAHAHDCEGWLHHCGNCPQKRDYPASLAFDLTRQMLAQKRRAFSRMDRLIVCCPSQWLADRVRRSFLSRVPIRRIFNGIDTETTFRPAGARRARAAFGLSESKVLLAVANDLMLPTKGGAKMLDLAERLRDVPVKLVLVGAPATLTAGNVVALPSISDQRQLADLYSAADLLVLPSRKETFSMVCAEALACGTPVVGLESGAPSEVAPPGFGVFVEQEDIDGLESEIRRELFGERRLACPQDCRDFATSRYSESVMADAYLDAYREAQSR